MRILQTLLILTVLAILSGPSGFQAEAAQRDKATLVFPSTAEDQIHELSVKESVFADNTLFWFVEGIEGEGAVQSMTGQIGLEPADNIVWGSETDGGTEFLTKTLILIDNSVSVSSSNREKTRRLLEQLIRRKKPEEVYSIASFSRELTVRSEYSIAQDTLITAAVTLDYQDQDAYLNDVLSDCIRSMKKDSRGDIYQKILLVSDGANDNPYGCTDAALLEILKERSCVVDVIDSGKTADAAGRNRLREIAANSGGNYLMLEEWEDMEQACQMLTVQSSLYRISIPVPYDCMDGLSRSVLVHFEADGQEYEIVREEAFPLIDAQFLKEWKQQEEILRELEQMETETVPDTEIIIEAHTDPEPQTTMSTEAELFSEMIPEETEQTQTEAPVEREPFPQTKDSSLGRQMQLSRLLLFAGAAAAGAALGILAWQIRKKTAGKDMDLQEEPEENEVYHSEFESGFSPASSDTDWSDSPETRMMWSDSDQNRMVLRDVSDHTRFYRLTLEQEIIVGRNADKCQVVLPGDPSVSSVHIRFTRKKEQIYLEDMNSANGTFLNGNRLEGRVPVRDGDLIKIGRTELMIEL